jgi:hypothetical protein
MTNSRKTWFSTVWGKPENIIHCFYSTEFSSLTPSNEGVFISELYRGEVMLRFGNAVLSGNEL